MASFEFKIFPNDPRREPAADCEPAAVAVRGPAAVAVRRAFWRHFVIPAAPLAIFIPTNLSMATSQLSATMIVDRYTPHGRVLF